MEFTAANIKAAGGIRHLCYYADSLNGRPDKWEEVERYIVREWRGIDDQEVRKLLVMCEKACDEANKCNLEVPS